MCVFICVTNNKSFTVFSSPALQRDRKKIQSSEKEFESLFCLTEKRKIYDDSKSRRFYDFGNWFFQRFHFICSIILKFSLVLTGTLWLFIFSLFLFVLCRVAEMTWFPRATIQRTANAFLWKISSSKIIRWLTDELNEIFCFRFHSR